MKSIKVLGVMIMAALLLATGSWTDAVTAAPKAVVITKNEGEPVPFQNAPILQGGTTLLPLREVGTLLNSKTTWIPEGKRIVITNPNNTIEMALGSKAAVINGKKHTMQAIPYNKKGVVYVPIRFISEAFGTEVTWHEKERRVNLQAEEAYLYDVQAGTGYWVAKKDGKLYTATGSEPAELVGDTKVEVKGYSEFTIDVLSDKAVILKVYDNYGEPGLNDIIFKMLLVDRKLTLDTEVSYYGHPIRSIDRTAEDHALLINGATIYEVDKKGKQLSKHDLKALTGYEDENFQVEWFDSEYMVVRPDRTGWLTLVDRDSGESILLAEALLDKEHWDIYHSLDKLNTEFAYWDGLKVVKRDGDKLILEHYLFIGGVTKEYVMDLKTAKA